MRSIILLVLMCYSQIGRTQLLLTGKIFDSLTQQPIPFVSIGSAGELGGGLSNEEGQFVVKVKSNSIVEFRLLGYAPKQINSNDWKNGGTILLHPNIQTLNEVVVNSNDEALYKTLMAVRQLLLKSKDDTARCYFLLSTTVNQKPVELMEMYYNAYWQAGAIGQLRFKNGRAAMAPYEDRYFMSKNHSALFKAASIVKPHTELPVHPLQCSARDLRKHYILTSELVESGDEKYRVIYFKSRKKNKNYCEGSLWLKQLMDVPIKYVFNARHTPRHPFYPWIPGEASIEDVNFQQEWQFKTIANHTVPFRGTITYDYTYSWLKLIPGKGGNLKIHTNLNAFFYDYENAFIEPLVNYDERIYDYRKIAGLSWNDQFWTDQHSMMTTRSTHQAIRKMLKDGITINYGENKVTYEKENLPLIKDLHVLWDQSKRLNVLHVSGDDMVNNKDRFNLKAQVYLDLNWVNGQLQWKSATIFDLYHSWCYLQNNARTNCFMNIYFDLFECARLEIESKLTPTTSPQQAQIIYKAIMKETNQLAERYLNEVRMGLNEEALIAWNEIIKKQLNIDNVQLFEVFKN